jgi:nucleotide-binding universal stress UspA family protein
MSVVDRRHIVVGVDGSSAATQAARWAAVVAAHRGVPLHLVHVVPLPTVFYGESQEAPAGAFRADGERIVSNALSVVRNDQPTLPVEGSQLPAGTPGDVLLGLAGDASMVVIGSSYSGRVEGYLNGTALQLTHQARCVLTVWRGTSRDAVPDSRAVVVGVDGSECSTAAVGQAFEFASLVGSSVMAVHSWQPGFLPASAPSTAPVTADPVAAAEEAVLSESLAGWRNQYPDVAVTEVTECGAPAEVLLRWCRDAQLLIVGSHGRSPLGRALLGSTSQDMLHRAPCPVMIFRHRQAPRYVRPQ